MDFYTIHFQMVHILTCININKTYQKLSGIQKLTVTEKNRFISTLSCAHL